MSGGVLLEHLSWVEAEPLLREIATAVIPIGARCKEHGHHLPLNNDWIMAERLAAIVAERARVLMLPTIPYAFYPAFVDYPGSVNVGREAFQATAMDICRSLARHGTRRCYFLNTGISTNCALEPARGTLAREGIVMDYLDLATAAADAKASVVTQSEGTHADEIETSMMLYLAPEVVKLALARPDIHPANGRGPLRRDRELPGTYSPTGAWGDPTRATVEKGRVVVEALVAHVIEFLQRFERDDFVADGPRTRYLETR